MANFYIGEIKNSTFHDQSAIIHNIEILPEPEQVNFGQIEKELAEIKSRLPQGSTDYQIVQKLETAAKKHKWESLASVALGFAEQFSAAALANLSGAYLSKLLGL